MADINSPIPYQWNLGWGKQLSRSRPVVTPLIKAIIEKDIPEMDRLVAMGADIGKSDGTTLQRVIFHVMDSYHVMKWLVDHGFSRLGNGCILRDNGVNYTECLSPHGYFWGIPARAYHLGAYDVLDLVAAHGFNDFDYYDLGYDRAQSADRRIFRSSDEKAIRILLQNGYSFGTSSVDHDYYQMYVLERPQVRRKTIGLDGWVLNVFRKTDIIPEPRYEDVPLFFGRQEAKERNQRRKEDYEDRVRAYEEFTHQR